MKSKFTKGDLVICIILLLFILFLFKSCMDANHRSDSLLKALNDTTSSLSYYKNAYNQATTSAKTRALQDKKQVEALTKDNKEMQELLKYYKTVSIAATINTTFARGKITIPLNPVAAIITDTGKAASSIQIPDSTCFEYFDDYLSIQGTIHKTDVTIDSLVVRNKIDIVAGEKKMGFWHPNEYRIDITNSNPYMVVQGITTYVIKPGTKWYNSKLLWLGIGLVGGIYISN